MVPPSSPKPRHEMRSPVSDRSDSGVGVAGQAGVAGVDPGQGVGVMLGVCSRLLVVLVVCMACLADGGNDSQRIKIRGVKWW